MADNNHFDVIIIGGSYAGLSAAMALGRSLRQVLIIDSGKPCNRQTPHSHNFITQDGETPAKISEKAKEQVLKYPTVRFLKGLAVKGENKPDGFEVQTDNGEIFSGRKLLLTTGVTDIMPPIRSFDECWGISVLHCPYCHGYEVKGKTLGIIGNGDIGFELSRLIYNWSKNLILFTNGKSTLTAEQTEKVKSHGIDIVENEISEFRHQKGYIQRIIFKDGSEREISSVFARAGFKQHTELPGQLGCKLSEQGYIQIDDFHKTSVQGVFAAGDNTTMFRSVSAAVAAGTKAGALINRELIEEEF